ncbi:MAG: leucine-rich repeat protein, partial [Ruminococcus sp.]
KTLTVPKVTGDSVFDSCDNLQKITIPSNVKTITKGEFWNCPKLKTVTVPKAVTKIGDYSLGYKENDWDYSSEKIKGFTIKGKTGSTAHKYAKKNGFKFVAI